MSTRNSVDFSGYFKRLSKTSVRWIPGLLSKYGLTHSELLLALLFESEARQAGGVKFCGGRSRLPVDMVEAVVSRYCRRRIHEVCSRLETAGALKGPVSVSEGAVSATVSRAFASDVSKPSGIYVGDLGLGGFDLAPGSAFSKLPVAVKVAAMLWSKLVSGGVFGERSGAEDPVMAGGFPGTAAMSRFLGVSDRWFRTVARRYNGVAWRLRRVWMDPSSPVKPYVFDSYFADGCPKAGWVDKGLVLFSLEPSIIHRDARGEALRLCDDIIAGYRSMLGTVDSFRRLSTRVAPWVDSAYSVDDLQRYYDWRCGILDGSLPLKMVRVSLEAVHAAMQEAEPICVEHLASATDRSAAACSHAGEILHAPLRFRCPTPEESAEFLRKSLSALPG